MVGRSSRLALCVLIGLLAGPIVGQLLVSDPTEVVAGAASTVAAATIAAGAYRTDWLRGEERTG